MPEHALHLNCPIYWPTSSDSSEVCHKMFAVASFCSPISEIYMTEIGVPSAGWRIHEIPDCASLPKTYDISVRVFSDHLPVQGFIKNLPDLQKTDNLFVSYAPVIVRIFNAQLWKQTMTKNLILKNIPLFPKL
jgi:hypothetical protein